MPDVEMFRKLFARLDSNHQGEREAALNLLYEHLYKRGKSFRDVLNALDDTVPKATHEELLKKFQEAAQRSAEWRRAYDELQRQARAASGTTSSGSAPSPSQPQQQPARSSSTKWGIWLVVALFVGVPLLATLGTNSPPRPASLPAVPSPTIAKPLSPATTSSTAPAVAPPPATVAAAPSPLPLATPGPVQPYFSTPPPPVPEAPSAPVAAAATPPTESPPPQLPPAASRTPIQPPQLYSPILPATEPFAAIDRRPVRSRDELIHYLHDANAFDAVLLDPAQRDIVLANLIDVYDGDPAAIAQHLKSWQDYPGDAPGSAINTEFVLESLADQARFDHTMAWLIWSYHGDRAEIATILQKLRNSHVHHAS